MAIVDIQADVEVRISSNLRFQKAIMWKRRPNKVQERQIGKPIFIESTADEAVLGRARNISDLRKERLNVNTEPKAEPVKQVSSHGMAELPPLPFRTLAPAIDFQDSRTSNETPLSSIHSQPTPEMEEGWKYQPPYAPTPAQYTDISPPASPDLQPSNGYHDYSRSRSVSPMQETLAGLGITRPQPRPSQIPVARKAPNARQEDWEEQRTTHLAPGMDTHDTFSGNRPFDGLYGVQTDVSAGPPKKSKRSAFGEKAARFGKALAIEPKTKEPWKGASGRHALVEPVADRPSSTPHRFPSRSHRQASGLLAPAEADVPHRSTPSPSAETLRTRPNGVDSRPVSNYDRNDTDDEHIKPVVPLKAGLNSPPRNISSPAGTQLSVRSNTSYSTLDPRAQPNHSTDSLPQSVISRKPVPKRDFSEPISRFSWTTYATSTDYQQSPPPSPPPPLPTFQLDPGTSIMDRKRPVPSVHSTKSARNSPDPNSTRNRSVTAPVSSSAHPTSPTSSSLKTKALPAPPSPEGSDPKDLISALERQLDALSLRKNNLSRLLSDRHKQVTENPLVTSLQQRRQAEEQRKEWERELEEVRVEEHEIGLKLHRAYRRRERAGGFEGTSAIWVRRVTE